MWGFTHRSRASTVTCAGDSLVLSFYIFVLNDIKIQFLSDVADGAEGANILDVRET